MKARIICGAAIAAATVSLALAGAAPAQAKGKSHRAPKATTEKHNCGGKNGCPAMGKGDDKAEGKSGDKAATPAADAKPAAPAADAKPAEGK